MSPRATRPPRLSRRLLEWAARRLGTPDLAADAAELFADKARAQGGRAARRWYARQARASLARLLVPGRRGDARATGGGWLAGISLDAKLAVRMLARYPGLTLVAGLAMAFAIFVGAATFELVDQLTDPTLPLPDGDRLVGLRYWDRAANEPARPLPSDLRLWRDELSTVEQVGAFEDVQLNLAMDDGAGEPVDVARISPVGFRVAGIPPLLGRSLVEADDTPGAPPVLVLGHRLWQVRFGGDPEVVSRTVRIGDERATVVGVMPEGFGFPQDDNLWMALRLPESPMAGGSVAPLHVFGRLAPGVTIEDARAEVAALEASALAARAVARGGGDAAVAGPERDARLTTQVLPYWESLYSFRAGLAWRAAFYHLNVYPGLFLILVSGNVALLIFARAATRERELVVRNALGASRGRIVTQLFVEALVLGALATVLGLALTGPALGRLYGELREIAGPFPLPFWVQPRLSAATVAYAVGLTLLGAGVAGVVPALKTTGRGMQTRLHQAAQGAGGPRLGGIWTAVIVTQIAATVVFTGGAWAVAAAATRNATIQAFFPAEQYLGMRVEMDAGAGAEPTDRTGEAFQRLYAARVRELEHEIAENAAVAGVTLVRRLPVKARGTAPIEVDEGGSAPLARGRLGHATYSDAVDLDFFEVFGAPVLSGRGFDARDLADDVSAVVVNASFVGDVLGGRSAPGRRIRYVGGGADGEPGPWHEIVGVVGDLVADQIVTQGFESPPRARVYHPLDPTRAGTYPVYVVAHVSGDPAGVATTLYPAAEGVSPALRLHEVATLDRAEPEIALMWRLFAYVVGGVSGVALFLSLAGIYAVMSFTVARRTREIGVRVALGARATRVTADIFRRPLAQVGAGVLSGCVLMGVVVWSMTGGRLSVRDGALLLALGIGMLAVCALACVTPILRALRVEPTVALNAET